MAGLNDDELDAILRAPKAPGMVSMLNPLEVYLSKRWLQRLCRSSLLQMQATLNDTTPTKDQKTVALVGMQQRIDFLAWLQQQPDDLVYVSMYPTDVDGTDDLEVSPDWFDRPE